MNPTAMSANAAPTNAEQIDQSALQDSGCVCPNCGTTITPDELASQGFSPSGQTQDGQGMGQAPTQDKAASAVSTEPDSDDLAAQKTVADFNQGRSGNYAANPGPASNLLAAGRRMSKTKGGLS